VHGPYDPEAGHRFNPHKLLIDPYSKRLGGQFAWTDAHLAYRVGNKREDLSFDRRDNARSMFKSVVVDQAHTLPDDWHPQVPWEDTIIYEAHVKGLTQLPRGCAEGVACGTYRGLAAPAMIEHMHKLGVTAIELLPIHSFVDEPHLLQHGLKNYWGYNSVSFFAPERRYGSEQIQNAFRSTVAELHSAGIEVILDVVYNHTAEGNHLGPTLCYRGIDNSAYYWLVPDTPRFYENYTGTGNALKLAHPRVLADDHGLAPLLGRGVPRRRVPLRSGFDARAHADVRSAQRVLRRGPAGPGSRQRQDDRRTMGHRPWRLSGRRLSARLVGVERPSTAERCGAIGVAMAACSATWPAR